MRDFGWFANKFETHHDVYLPAGQCWHMIYTLNLYTKKPQNKTSENKFNVNTTYPRRSRWDFQRVLDDTLFLHLELTWITISRIEETKKYCQVLGDLLLLLLSFIYWRFMGSCAALRWFCTRICIFTVLFRTYSSHFVLMYILSLCCMPHLINFSEVLSCVCSSACFHTITLDAFAFRALSSLLLLLTNRWPAGFLPAHSLVGDTLPKPYHRSFNNLFITIFSFIIHFEFSFVLNRNFYFDQYNVHQSY